MTGKLRLYASLGFSGADRDDEVNLPDDWDDMTQQERDAWCEEALNEHIIYVLESGYEVVEDES